MFMPSKSAVAPSQSLVRVFKEGLRLNERLNERKLALVNVVQERVFHEDANRRERVAHVAYRIVVEVGKERVKVRLKHGADAINQLPLDRCCGIRWLPPKRVA
jgi:hypothetical protein